MSELIKTFVAVDTGVSRDAIDALLPSGSEIQVVGLVDGLEESWAMLQETPNDLLVIACAGYSERALYMIAGAVKERPDRPIVVLSEGSANGFVRRVFEAGADDILTLPQPSEGVLFVLQKAMARRQGSSVAAGLAIAPMICVLGPKGGTGKTLTTTNLAVVLAELGHKVVVVDLDLQFGDVGLAFGLSPTRTVHDLVKSGGALDAEKIDAYLATHPSGVRALLAPTRPDHAGGVSADFLREVYLSLRSIYDFMIVDTPPGFTPEVIASIDSSSHVCMVGMLDSLSLKNTKLGFETLELMGYAPERVRLVLNRADTRVGISRDDVVAIVGRAPDVFVPSDREIPRSINEGNPIVRARPKSEAAKAFRTLAGMYLYQEDSAKSKRRRLRKAAA